MTKSMMEKVRVQKPRPPEPTQKERAAWDRFLEMASSPDAETDEKKTALKAELDRLAGMGHPLAIRLQEKIAREAIKPRAANGEPVSKPPMRRFTGLKWGRPGKAG